MGTRRLRRDAWRAVALAGLALLGFAASNAARAVPMFARETGQPCAACHIGGFGPQLTPFGRQFKLDGYRLDVHKGWDTHLSAMAVESFTHTQQPQAAPPAPNMTAPAPGGATSSPRPTAAAL